MPIAYRSSRRPSRSRQSGFSLLELLVVMAILAGLIAAILGFFDFSNQVANVQTQVSDMQQSLRAAQADMVRVARMAGRGGLPSGNPTQWLAVGVRNNVTTVAEREIAGGGSPVAVAGTDILTLRGCYDTLIQVNSLSATDFTRVQDPGTGDYPTGTLRLTNPSSVDLAQDLEPLRDATGRALLLVSVLDESIYTVAEITQVTPTPPTGPPTEVNLQLNLAASKYLGLAGGTFNRALATVQWACLLEEYRYYVREEHAIPADPTSPLAPKLTRARMEPGLDTPFEGDARNLTLDLADNVFDLQAAVAFDSDYPAANPAVPGAFEDDADFVNQNPAVPDDTIYEGPTLAERDQDDWLFNSTADQPANANWSAHHFVGNTSPVAMQYLRLTTLARTDQPDGKYLAPLLDHIEDHDFTTPPSNDFNSAANRHFRRRLLQTVIDLRNL
jgi:prepilin-type N-terminal cleavage/methylation domain-containing protein